MDERADLTGRYGRPENLTIGTPIEPAPVAEPLDQEDPDEIRDDIEQTRSAMSETIDAIQDRLSPETLVTQATERVREATIGRAEQVVNDATDTARQTGSSIWDTIRQNPVPAALAAFGIGWLWTHRQTATMDGDSWQGYRSAPPRATYREYGPNYGNYGQTSGRGYDAGYGRQYGTSPQSGGVGETVSNVQDRVGDMAAQAQDQAGQMVGQVQDQMGQWGDQASQSMDQLRWQFDRLLHENPLAIGAVALGLGAAVGMAIPSTPQENQFMGEARDTVVDRAQSMAQDTMEKVQHVAQDAGQAAQQAAQKSAQDEGLTGQQTQS